MEGRYFSFSAVAGLEMAKRALLLQLVNPACGGVLISGPAGTGKSLLVNSIPSISPEQKITRLPLGATADMVFGSLDVETALETGEKRVIPGILHRADNSILVLDNVNLMQKDFVRAVCNSYHNGFFELQREGACYRGEVSFSPVGIMTPEEGSLTSLELACFGIFVNVENITDVADRRALDRQLLEYEQDPQGVLKRYREADQKTAEVITMARTRLGCVEVPRSMCILIANICARANVAGNDAELYLLESARAIAALAGRNWVMPQDVVEAAQYVLPHRMRKKGEDQVQTPNANYDNSDVSDNASTDLPDSSDKPVDKHQSDSDAECDMTDYPGDSQSSVVQGGDLDRLFAALLDIHMPHLELVMNKRGPVSARGRRLKALSNNKRGRYVGYVPKGDRPFDISLDATLKAAAPYQIYRRTKENKQRVVIRPEDYQNKIREQRAGINLLFLVDASGSMGAKERMRVVKGAIFSLLREAYQKRDNVGMIAFRRQRAEVILPLTRSVEMAQKKLHDLPVGGRTPLVEGLECALGQIVGLQRRDGLQKIVLFIITDGRVNSTYKGDDPVTRSIEVAHRLALTNAHIVVVDSESGFVRLGIAQMLAMEMGAAYYPLQELTTRRVLRLVESIKQSIHL